MVAACLDGLRCCMQKAAGAWGCAASRPMGAWSRLLQDQHQPAGPQDAGAAEDEPEAKAVEPWQRRLYFVRLPKPQQDDHSTELRQLEQELEAFKTQTQLLNESINIRKVRCVCSSGID